ncbi:hypothetical protein [Caudoviricetes sp.]|nr:hypothetical protein [Caudoviricetes sp.]
MKYNKPIEVLGMSIYRVKKTNLYDIFTGKGWKSHRRIKKVGDNISVIEGSDFSGVQRAAIVKSIGEQNARG